MSKIERCFSEPATLDAQVELAPGWTVDAKIVTTPGLHFVCHRQEVAKAVRGFIGKWEMILDPSLASRVDASMISCTLKVGTESTIARIDGVDIEPRGSSRVSVEFNVTVLEDQSLLTEEGLSRYWPMIDVVACY